MIKQNWNIGIEEKIRILNLHESATKKQYLILEQENVEFSENFGNEFKSGDFNLNSTSLEIIKNKVKNIAEFIKNKNIKNYKIVISAGESKVPNNPPFNRKGSLAEKRAETLKNYLTTALTNIFGYTPEMEISKPKIGKTDWVAGKDNKDDPKYTAEQFVKANVVVTSEPPYNRKANFGEPIYLNQSLIGYISEPSVNTSNIKDSGNMKLGYKNLIFTEIKKDTVPQEVIARYEIPWAWWNGDEYQGVQEKRERPTTRNVTLNDLAVIRRFKKV